MLNSPRERIRVLIVDDMEDERLAVIHTLSMIKDEIEIVGQAHNGRKAIEMARTLDPHIILMDHEMPGLNGIQTMRAIHEEDPLVGIIFITKHANDDDIILGALRSGSRGYLAKPPDAAEVAHAVRVVAAGEAIFSPGVARKLLNIFNNQRTQEIVRAFPSVTPREQEVLSLIARGARDVQISQELTISKDTLRAHKRSIYEKLAVHDRAEVLLRIFRETRTLSRECPNCGLLF